MIKENQLIMRFKKTKDPFLEEQGKSQYDLWGEVTLQYGDKVLLKSEWELHNWISKFIENKEILLTQKFPFQYTDSIKESYDDLMASIDFGNLEDESIEIPESAFEQVELYSDYISNHAFHLMGTTTQSFYIGLNPAGVGEISYYIENEDKYYKYEFDMSTFVNQADLAIISYLKKFQLKLTSDEESLKKTLGDYYKYIGEGARLDAMS